MAGVPAQRAVQRPLTAATATQRILGRAVTQNATVPVAPFGVAQLNGQFFDVNLRNGASRRLVKRKSVPVVRPHLEVEES